MLQTCATDVKPCLLRTGPLHVFGAIPDAILQCNVWVVVFVFALVYSKLGSLLVQIPVSARVSVCVRNGARALAHAVIWTLMFSVVSVCVVCALCACIVCVRCDVSGVVLAHVFIAFVFCCLST